MPLFSRSVLSLVLFLFPLSLFLSLEKGHIMVFICTGEAQITTICSQHGETKTAGSPSSFASASFNISLSLFPHRPFPWHSFVHYNIAHIALCASHQTIVPSYLPEYFQRVTISVENDEWMNEWMNNAGNILLLWMSRSGFLCRSESLNIEYLAIPSSAIFYSVWCTIQVGYITVI